MEGNPNSPFNPQTFLSQIGNGKSSVKAPQKKIIFSQGDSAEAVFYIRSGKVTLSVVSQGGKEAIVAVLEKTAFFGEECLAGQRVYMATATILETATLLRISKTAMIQILHDEPAFSELFLAHLLASQHSHPRRLGGSTL